LLKERYSAIDDDANNGALHNRDKGACIGGHFSTKDHEHLMTPDQRDIMDNCHCTAACFAVFTRDSIEHLLQNHGVTATDAESIQNGFMMIDFKDYSHSNFIAMTGNNYELRKTEYKREEKERMKARKTNGNVMRLKFCISLLYQAITILIESNGKEKLVLSFMSPTMNSC
jgi:hypothetical protein